MQHYPLKREERVLFELRALYQRYGYQQYKMGKFEEYDLYAQNRDFLVSEGVITFTDTDGRLMALKPDVTLSIIRNTRDREGLVHKVCYSENVYRVSGSTRQYKEIMQTGLECIGDVDLYHLCEVIDLAAESLERIDPHNVLELSHMGVVAALVNRLDLTGEDQAAALRCIGEKNLDGLRAICPTKDLRALECLMGAHGDPQSVIEALKPHCEQGLAKLALQELEAVTHILHRPNVQIDFSIVNDMNYYNGIVFQGYIQGIPTDVLSGGQYDKLMQRMGRRSRAVGFAIYMDQLERLADERRPYDVDVLVIYDDTADLEILYRKVSALISEGLSVSVQKAAPDNLRYSVVRHFKGGDFID